MNAWSLRKHPQQIPKSQFCFSDYMKSHNFIYNLAIVTRAEGRIAELSTCIKWRIYSFVFGYPLLQVLMKCKFKIIIIIKREISVSPFKECFVASFNIIRPAVLQINAKILKMMHEKGTFFDKESSRAF